MKWPTLILLSSAALFAQPPIIPLQPGQQINQSFENINRNFYYLDAKSVVCTGIGINSIACNPSPAVTLSIFPLTQYNPGMTVAVTMASSNTGAATLNIAGIGASPVLSSAGSPLTAGQLTAGNTYFMVWTGAAFILTGGTGGYVTTSGSPSAGNITKFSAATVITNAVAGTDYASPTNGSSGNILTSNGSGGFGTVIVPATGIATFLAAPSSANLLAAMTTSTGSGNTVFATSPTLITPNLGTPTAINLTNGLSLPAGGLASVAADNIFGNFTGSSAVPSTQAIPFCANDGSHSLVYPSHTLTCATLTGFANPMTTLGDTIYGGVSGVATRLPGNTAATDQVLVSTGTGSAAQAPTLKSAPALSAINMTSLPNSVYCLDASGSATTYTCPTPTPAITSLPTALNVLFVPQTLNAANPTVNINGLGAKALVQAIDGVTPVTAGTLAAGQYYSFSYNGTAFVQQGPVPPLVTAPAVTYFAPPVTGGAALSATAIVVSPTITTGALQTIVSANPANTTFIFLPGYYQRQVITTPKNGDYFYCPSQACDMSGSVTVTGWATAGSNYSVSVSVTDHQDNGTCQSGTICQQDVDIYFDSHPLTRVTPGGSCAATTLVSGQATLIGSSSPYIACIKDNPSGHLTEISDYIYPYFIGGSVADITIRGFLVEKYASAWQYGAIGWQFPGYGWTVADSEVRLCHGTGIHLISGHIVHSFMHDMGEQGGSLGYFSYNSTGDVLSDSELSFNNYALYNTGNEGGGIKIWATYGAHVRNNYIHDNYGTGLWFDTDNSAALIEDNRIMRNNTGSGFAWEISRACTFRNNVLSDNGVGATGLFQILISSSGPCDIYGNTVNISAAINAYSIIGLNAPASGTYSRGNDPSGQPYRLSGNLIHGNTINCPGNCITGFADNAGASTTVTGASNANPIVITAANNYFNGDWVTCSGVLGNTAANGTFQIGAVSSTGFSLIGVAGNGAWSGGGTQQCLFDLARSATFDYNRYHAPSSAPAFSWANFNAGLGFSGWQGKGFDVHSSADSATN